MATQTEILADSANVIDAVLRWNGLPTRVTGGHVEREYVQFWAPLVGFEWLERALARALHITTCRVYVMIEIRGDENGVASAG